MFVIRRKSDGKFLRRTPSWVAIAEDRNWTESIGRARVFGRKEDAKQSRGWRRGEYTKPYPNYTHTTSSEEWNKRRAEYAASFVAYTDETRPTEIVKVYLIPEDALKG